MLNQMRHINQGNDCTLNTARKVVRVKLDRDDEHEAFTDLSLAEQRRFLAIRDLKARAREVLN